MLFFPGGARPPFEVLRDFVSQNPETYGVEPICKVLQVAPSGYRRHAAHKRNPDMRCVRARRDDTLIPKIEKVWKQMNRDGITVAPCTVERLMKRLGLQGVRRGKVVRTTTGDANAMSTGPCAPAIQG